MYHVIIGKVLKTRGTRLFMAACKLMQLLSQYNCDYCHIASLVTIRLDFPQFGMYMWELESRLKSIMYWKGIFTFSMMHCQSRFFV